MVIKGICFSVSTINDNQYELLGDLWDLLAKHYGRENLQGIGFNWTDKKMDYAISCVNEEIDIELVKEIVGSASYRDILLPDGSWEDYQGKTARLALLYDEIYAKGAPTYEIETFDDEGNCYIKICRNYPKLVTLKEDDLDEIVSLYSASLGREGCVWNEEYPTKSDFAADLKEQCLFGIKDDQGKIVAAIARDRDENVERLDCWEDKLKPGAELARLTVATQFEHQGVARVLIKATMEKLFKQGFKSVHFLVAKANKVAINSYSTLGFNLVGETEMFGHDYFCYEKQLK